MLRIRRANGVDSYCIIIFNRKPSINHCIQEYYFEQFDNNLKMYGKNKRQKKKILKESKRKKFTF